jgi:RNA polymerase sigma-70 factor (ECF subfamily)
VSKNRSAHVLTDEAEHLVARFRRPLLSYFSRRVADPSEVEDLTQEVFLRLLRRDEAVPVDNPEIYVFRIAVNLLRDRARRAAAHRAGEHASLDDQASGFGERSLLEPALVEERQPERVLLSQEALMEVMRVLDKLDPRTREIFVLSRLERMKHREIAAIYGMTVSAVEKHVAKAAVLLLRRVRRS